jgi:two-component sensor histidine kinase
MGGVRGRLLGLVAAATIPIAAIAGNNAWNSYQTALSNGLLNVVVLREVSAARHGAAVDALREMVTGLAERGRLLDMTPEACDAQLDSLRSLKPERYSNFWVLDPDGVLVCSGRPAERGRSYADLDYVSQLRRARSFILGDFTIGMISGRAVLPGVAPIVGADGVLRGMVGGSLFLDLFLRSERGDVAAGSQQVWLLDQEGTTLPLGAAMAHALPPPETLQAMLRETHATVQGTARNGSAYAWSLEELGPGLRLLVGLRVEEVQEAAQRALNQRMLELAIFLLACLAAILIGVEAGVARPLRRLAARVREWAPGRPYVPQARGNVPAEVRDLDRALTNAATALQEREAALTAALTQRDLLMADIHHRVKNNLQIVASLLNLQAETLRNGAARREFAVARDRVQALATLHRHLYMNQSFERITLVPFLQELSRQLSDALGAGHENDVAIRIDADDIELGSDEAISLALLLTEAVSNAMRHAFPDGRRGTISIILRVADNEARLDVVDDGIGMADDGEGDGLGKRLIEGFAQHLGGTAEIRSDSGGTRVCVRFPLVHHEHEPALSSVA